MNKQNHSFLTGDFVDAFYNRQVCVLIPHLKTAKPCLLDAAGRPRPITGNFSAVFRLQSSDGKIWAAKCFTRPQDNLAHRYQAIGNALAQLNAPWIVDFQYHEKGLIAGGRHAPVLVMQWLEGLNLREFVANNLNQPKLLRKLAKDLARAIVKLEDAKLAHGDLQHGNILVQPDGEFFLIDYDGMFVPQLASQPPGEKGMRHYQSPLRQDDTYGPGLDRFSGWVICLSLLALAEAPDLWTSLRTGSDECLILRDDHFRDPSGVVAELRSRNRSTLDWVADQLEQILPLPLDQIPSLSKLVLRFSSNPGDIAVSPMSNKPNWMTEDPQNRFPMVIAGPDLVNVASQQTPVPPARPNAAAPANKETSSSSNLNWVKAPPPNPVPKRVTEPTWAETLWETLVSAIVFLVLPLAFGACMKASEPVSSPPALPRGVYEVLGEPAAEEFARRLMLGEVVSLSELKTSDRGASDSFISFSFKSENPNVGITVRNPMNNPDSVQFSLSSEDWIPFVSACYRAQLTKPNYGKIEELFSRECLKGFPKPVGGTVRLLVSSSHTKDGVAFCLIVEHLDFAKRKGKPLIGRNWFAYWVGDRDGNEFLETLLVSGTLVEFLKARRGR